MTLPNNEIFKARHFVNCQSVGVVYLMYCTCNRFYIGKTKRKFSIRIMEHVKSISNCKDKNIHELPPVARHVVMHHGKNLKGIKFFALDHVHTDIRGGSIDGTLLQLETRWIHKLKATIPPGLNNYLSFKNFFKS